METDLYTVDDGTLLSFTKLKPAEREALDRVMASLGDLPEQDWPTQGAIRLGLFRAAFRNWVVSSSLPFLRDFLEGHLLEMSS